MQEYNNVDEILEDLEGEISQLDLKIARLEREIQSYKRARRKLLKQQEAVKDIIRLSELYGNQRQNP